MVFICSKTAPSPPNFSRPQVSIFAHLIKSLFTPPQKKVAPLHAPQKFLQNTICESPFAYIAKSLCARTPYESPIKVNRTPFADVR